MDNVESEFVAYNVKFVYYTDGEFCQRMTAEIDFEAKANVSEFVATRQAWNLLTRNWETKKQFTSATIKRI